MLTVGQTCWVKTPRLLVRCVGAVSFFSFLSSRQRDNLGVAAPCPVRRSAEKDPFSIGRVVDLPGRPGASGVRDDAPTRSRSFAK